MYFGVYFGLQRGFVFCRGRRNSQFFECRILRRILRGRFIKWVSRPKFVQPKIHRNKIPHLRWAAFEGLLRTGWDPNRQWANARVSSGKLLAN